MFSEICPEICLEIRPEISCAFLAGRKVLPKNYPQIFPIGDFKYQIKFHQNFYYDTLLQAWQP